MTPLVAHRNGPCVFVGQARDALQQHLRHRHGRRDREAAALLAGVAPEPRDE